MTDREQHLQTLLDAANKRIKDLEAGIGIAMKNLEGGRGGWAHEALLDVLPVQPVTNLFDLFADHPALPAVSEEEIERRFKEAGWTVTEFIAPPAQQPIAPSDAQAQAASTIAQGIPAPTAPLSGLPAQARAIEPRGTWDWSGAAPRHYDGRSDGAE